MKKFKVKVNGTDYEVEVEEMAAGSAPAQPVEKTAPAQPKTAPKLQPTAAPKAAGGIKITSPMPGTILNIKVNAGAVVKRGQVLMILEAMKMENDIVATQDGTVASINVQKGSTVNSGDVLATLS